MTKENEILKKKVAELEEILKKCECGGAVGGEGHCQL
jgi:hypothetical protein